MATLTIIQGDGPGDPETMASEAGRIAGLIRQGHRSGRAAGGSWWLKVDAAPDAEAGIGFGPAIQNTALEIDTYMAGGKRMTASEAGLFRDLPAGPERSEDS